MKNYFLCLCLMLTAFLSATPVYITSPSHSSLVGAKMLDFSNETTGTYVSYTSSNGDITFTGTTNVNIGTSLNGSYGNVGIHFNHSFGNAFRITFANDVTAVGFIWGAADSKWTVSLFTADNVLRGSIRTVNGSPYLSYEGAYESAGFRYLVFTPDSSDYISIDNLSYVFSNVPEPSAFLLVFVAIGFFFYFQKNR